MKIPHHSLPLFTALIADALSRIYLGCDGMLVPLITQAEKRRRHDKVLTRQRTLRPASHALTP